MELLPSKIDINEFIEVSVEKINEFHRLIKDGREVPTNMHKYRLYNTLQYYSVEWEEQYLESYLKNYMKSTTCFPLAEEVIRYLYGKVRLGILTNSYDSEEQRKRIKSTDISKYFDDIVVCSDVRVYKPAKEAFLYLADKYKIEPSSCLYIGDSEEYDIKGAKNAGLFAVRVCHGNRSRVESTADFICDGLDELLSFLENCFGVYV